MKLFYSPGACSMASHMILNELGVKFTPEKVDLAAKKYSGGDYKQINPNGYVPAVQMEDGTVLAEGAAILQYLGDQKPEKNLIPKAGTNERYKCVSWLTFVSSEVHKTLSLLWSDKTPADFKNYLKESLYRRLDFVEKHFKAGNSFLMGNQYMVPDAYLFTVLGWSDHLKVDLSKYPSILGFMERVKTRPATMTTMKTEGLLK